MATLGEAGSPEKRLTGTVDGVSIVVCCHNSAKRLPETLAHLARQEVDDGTPWEVIVIDNASTDNTAEIGLTAGQHESAQLRVIHESRLGLSYARECGFKAARYGVVSFVDDDNWLMPGWVQSVANIMAEHPEVGACGGRTMAVSDGSLPFWFETCKMIYAITPEDWRSGDMTFSRGALFGAGLSIRKLAWEQLVEAGFRSQSVDRQGTALLSGGDMELCLALRLAGWRLWFDSSLQLNHFLPAERLQWDYLRRLHRGSGMSTVSHDAYWFALKPRRTGVTERLRHVRQTWHWQVFSTILIVVRRSVNAYFVSNRAGVGNPSVLEFEGSRGRLAGLIRNRRLYNLSLRAVDNLTRFLVTTSKSKSPHSS